MAKYQRSTLLASLAVIPHRQRQQIGTKAALTAAIALGLVWLLVRRLAEVDLAAFPALIGQIGALQWLSASLATAISFWAVGRYDGEVHGYLGTGVAPATARRAGSVAIAISQTLGFGAITGALVRWHMLPGLSLWQTTRLTALVTVFFLGGWAVVTASVLLATPGAPFKAIVGLAMVLISAGVVICLVGPTWGKLRWPNGFLLSRLVALSALDTVMAALALWVLCPPDLALPFIAILPAFLLAFGAGLISGTPGGIGAFEITLLALLPAYPEASLLGAVVAWRLVYFAAPACLGALVALRGPAIAHPARPRHPRTDLAARSRRAEIGLMHQGQLRLIGGGPDQAWLSGRTQHCLVGLLDPVSDPEVCDQRLAISALISGARAEDRLPVIYKCSARTAAAARRQGLKLLPIAREAWLEPKSYRRDVPARANLRRKLRRAETAGVSVLAGPPDWQALERIAADWASRHGGERGFSMGRFCREYLETQRLYIAEKDGVPVAFISFHLGKTEWVLDLMRQSSTAPDGSMHLLIDRAIADAATAGLARISLAAVPLAALANPGHGWFRQTWHRWTGGSQSGLAQFKSGFEPEWQTLYLAAPHLPGLALAAAEIARAVMFPAPLGVAAHDDHA